MIAVERTTTISASAETIWATLADFAAISAWASNVDHSCLMSEQNRGCRDGASNPDRRLDHHRNRRAMGASRRAWLSHQWTSACDQVAHQHVEPGRVR